MSQAALEAFRLLRTSLRADGNSAKTVLVSSALPKEGKSTTSVNLAAALALEGRRTLLIDCDLRRSQLHRLFRVPRDPGLSQVLRGEITAPTAIRATFIDGLSFLPAGRYSASTADLLGSDHMAALLEYVAPHFDRVIIDSPPVLAVADATVLSALVDVVLLVVRAGGTDRKAVQQALQQLSSAGGHVIGAVLNDARGEAQRYGEYYYVGDYAVVGD